MFPDVGGSYFLPRLPGEIGTYLGLTGARLKAADCLYAGIGDCYVPDDRHDDLIAGLRHVSEVGAVLDELAEDPGAPPLAHNRPAIRYRFGHDSREGIITPLSESGVEVAVG